MKISKYDEVRMAIDNYTSVAFTGCRNQRNEYEKMCADWIKKNCRERKKNSAYIFYVRRNNYGTFNYPDLCDCVEYVNFDSKKGYAIRETEKSFIIENKYGKTVISKSSVIGWMAE